MVLTNTQMMGMDLAFPDVCLTPAGPVVVPIPYPNLAMAPTDVPSQFTTYVLFMPVHNLATQGTISNGDNAGVSMGVASGMMMGPSRNLLGSFTTFVGGPPATKMLSMSLQNSTNMVGMSLVPSQVMTIMLS